MSTKDTKKYGCSGLFALVALAFAGLLPASGMVAADEETVIEETVVTGSRIRDPNVLSSSQIIVVDVEDILNRGITRVEDYLNDLPQVSPGQAITNANGANGTATVNLRNLGCSRTLVLVNGQRMAPGTTGGGNCADLNTIPTLLLERVDVLTGGASSVYGSDALAGVVNFILDDEFEGLKASYTTSMYQHKNDNGKLRSLVKSYDYQTAPSNITTGETTKIAAAFGGSIFDGRGHFTGFFEKTDTQPIVQGDYDISACALAGGTSRCGGSSTIPPGRWADFGGYKAAGLTNSADAAVTGLDLKVLGDEFVDRDGQTYNYNPTNFFQRPDERTNLGFFGKFEVTEFVEAYVNVRAMNSESNAQIAYSGTFGNITELPCYNPLLSKQQYDTVCGNWVGMGGSHAPDFATNAEALAYISGLDIAVGDESIVSYKAPLYSLKRNVEGNPRQDVTTYKSLMQTFGVRGEFSSGWSYDISYQRGEVDYTSEYRNDLSVIAINRAINVVSVAGVPTCVSTLNGADSACVPYNLFQGGLAGDAGIQGVIDGGAELQNYIANATNVLGDSQQTILAAVISGETGLALPSAPSGISVAVGYESRTLKTDYRPDLPSRTGDRSGSGGATLALSGSYDVNEYFFEVGVPVTDSLSAEIGYRYADYSTDNTTDAYKVGVYWQAHEDVSLRASYQTSTRHASLTGLYRAQGFGLVDLDDDPCGESKTRSQAECANTGLASDLYGTDLKSPADQYNIRTGGNPEVAPEESTSVTAGLVVTPTLLPGMTFTVDYFSIEVLDGIGSIPATTSLTKCLDTGNSAFCNLINRNPVNGSLWLTGGYISTQTTNLSEETVEGVDIIFSYNMDTRFGNLLLEGVTTRLTSFELIELPGEKALECAGYWGAACGKNPLPKWSGNYKATLSTAYEADVSLSVRYLGNTDDLNTSNPIDFDSQSYLDMAVVWSPFENYQARFGINNVLDNEPPVTSNAGTAPGNGNTFPAYFDALGRYMFLTVEASF